MGKNSLVLGVILTFIGHAVWVSTILLLKSTFPDTGPITSPGAICFFLVVFLGLSQWVYLIPLILWFRRKGLSKVAVGLLVGGCVTFVVNLAIILLAHFLIPWT
jgi:hypothetical protein